MPYELVAEILKTPGDIGGNSYCYRTAMGMLGATRSNPGLKITIERGDKEMVIVGGEMTEHLRVSPDQAVPVASSVQVVHPLDGSVLGYASSRSTDAVNVNIAEDQQ